MQLSKNAEVFIPENTSSVSVVSIFFLGSVSSESCFLLQIKASSHHKGPYDFDLLVPVQELPGEHMVSGLMKKKTC